MKKGLLILLLGKAHYNHEHVRLACSLVPPAERVKGKIYMEAQLKYGLPDIRHLLALTD